MLFDNWNIRLTYISKYQGYLELIFHWLASFTDEVFTAMYFLQIKQTPKWMYPHVHCIQVPGCTGHYLFCKCRKLMKMMLLLLWKFQKWEPFKCIEPKLRWNCFAWFFTAFAGATSLTSVALQRRTGGVTQGERTALPSADVLCHSSCFLNKMQ